MSVRTSTALLTDQYELTMLAAAFRSGRAERRCAFEVFGRRLPAGRRYGIVGGTGRVAEAVTRFRFTDEQIDFVSHFLDDKTTSWLADFRFRGDIDAYPEGELYFPDSPILTAQGTFAECVMLETLLLSILNFDTAIASAAARMVSASNGRPLIEMGSRRTNEEAAVFAARAAYLAGFTTTSNLEAGLRFGIPTGGTSAHAFTLLFTDKEGPQEQEAFAAQVADLGVGTTLLVDTYDITEGVRNAVAVAGPDLGAIRIDSGELGVLVPQVRRQLDDLGARNTRIVVSGDLDEYAIAALRSEPIDSYGVGTSLVTGSGAPTAGLVYKLVEVDGTPVAKRSAHKQSRGGVKLALRVARPSGTLVEERILLGDAADAYRADPTSPAVEGSVREVARPLLRGGEPVASDWSDLSADRARVADGLRALPWEGLALSEGEPAIPTVIVS